MDVENTFIKPLLLFYFGKGRSEIETHGEVSKQYAQLNISLKTINKWFIVFRKENKAKKVNKKAVSKKKISDDYLIRLINDNPDLTMEKLARLADISCSVISRRISKLNREGEEVNYQRKDSKKFSDEQMINLVNKNPDLNMRQLAVITESSEQTISARLKKINSNGERAKYISKKNQKDKIETKNFTDEFLIDLINNNPSLCIKELARLADTTQSTISNRLKQINKGDEKVNYNKKNLVKFTDEFLINLINKHPDYNMEKLAIIANTTQRTIARRIQQINSDGERVKYINKKARNGKVFTDESLIDLINENPDLTMQELAKIIGTSNMTISRRIRKINKDGEKVKYFNKKSKNLTGVNEKLNPNSKLTDEYLIELVNNNPNLNMKELAKLTGTSINLVKKRLKQINWIDARENYSNGLS